MSKSGRLRALQAVKAEPEPSACAPRVDSVQLRADVKVDAAPAQRPARAAARVDDSGELLGQDAELRLRRAHGKTSVRLRLDLGIDADEDIDARLRLPARDAAARAAASSADSSDTHASGVPSRARRAAASKSCVGLADALEDDVGRLRGRRAAPGRSRRARRHWP